MLGVNLPVAGLYALLVSTSSVPNSIVTVAPLLTDILVTGVVALKPTGVVALFIVNKLPPKYIVLAFTIALVTLPVVVTLVEMPAAKYAAVLALAFVA